MQDNCEFETLERLQECHAERGVARQALCRQSEKTCKPNQNRVGVINHYMLKDILKSQSEHLWTDVLMW